MRGGFGPYGAGGTDPDDSAFDRGTYGVMYEAGVGLNIFLSDAHESGGWVLTPTLMNQIGHNAGVGKADAKFTTQIMSLGLEISWWSVLPRDQLDLSIDKAYEPEKSIQSSKSETRRTPSTSKWGAGDGLSLNYERIFGEVGLRLGMSKSDSDDGSVVSVPVTVSYLGIGSLNHMLEVGAGGAIAHVSGSESKHGFDGESYGDGAR